MRRSTALYLEAAMVVLAVMVGVVLGLPASVSGIPMLLLGAMLGSLVSLTLLNESLIGRTKEEQP